MLKTLGAQIKEYKKASIATPIYMILEVVFEMIIPFLMGKIADVGVKDGDLGYIVKIGLLMVLLAAAGLFTGVMGGIYGAKASTGFAKNLRTAMYNNIQTFSFANIDKFSTAGLVTRLTTDVTNVQNAYQMLIRMCARTPVTVIVALVMAFIISPKIAGIYLIATLILAVVLGLIMFFSMRYFAQIFVKYDALNESVQENITAIRVVKSFVREEHEKKKFFDASNNVYKMFVNAEKILAFNAPSMIIAVNVCILIVSWLGAHMVVSQSISVGNLMSLLAYCMNIMTSLMMFSAMFVMITLSLTSARRIAEVIEEKADIVNPDNPIFEVKDGSIDFENVMFAYNSNSENPVLSDINLHIKSGETIGIIGGTGSSKTSLVNLISRLYDVTGGNLFVGGQNVKKYDLKTLRDEVSVVLQKNVLFSGSIYENLRWGDASATDEDCQRACKLAFADEFIEKFPDGYNTILTQGGTNVSGGQKQRLCIARALLKKPKILILDDSTSAVDTATDAKIRESFAKEIPDTTKLIIAQRINSVMNADRIIVLDDGRISGIGTHQELLESNNIYKEVYDSQIGGGGDK